jgi:hypothetical protein
MKTVSKRAVAVLIVAILAIGPAAAALPADHGDYPLPGKIVRIIKKLQQIFGVGSQTDQPTPPRP